MTTLREALQSIYDQHKMLTPQLVVDTARDKDHPLHNRFEWNDAVAGEQWRREQARDMIQCVTLKVISPKQKPVVVREYHSVKNTEGQTTFVPLQVIQKDDYLKQQVLENARRDIRAFKARYSALSVLELRNLVMQELDETPKKHQAVGIQPAV